MIILNEKIANQSTAYGKKLLFAGATWCKVPVK